MVMWSCCFKLKLDFLCCCFHIPATICWYMQRSRYSALASSSHRWSSDRVWYLFLSGITGEVFFTMTSFVHLIWRPSVNDVTLWVLSSSTLVLHDAVLVFGAGRSVRLRLRHSIGSWGNWEKPLSYGVIWRKEVEQWPCTLTTSQ
jgi:hypothetical protein